MSDTPDVVVVDYGAGNLTSVSNALRHLGCSHIVSKEPEAVRTARRVIFPGVGGAGAAMAVIRAQGLEGALRSFHASGRPLLGICIGSQIAFDRSEEDATTCMGLLPGTVRLHPGRAADGCALKVPHMGWNTVRFVSAHPLFLGIADGSPFYFVHSYYAEPLVQADVLATTVYGFALPAVVGRGNLVATQFHMEKSGEAGLAMLRNFLGWTPGAA